MRVTKISVNNNCLTKTSTIYVKKTNVNHCEIIILFGIDLIMCKIIIYKEYLL